MLDILIFAALSFIGVGVGMGAFILNEVIQELRELKFMLDNEVVQELKVIRFMPEKNHDH